MRQYCEGVVEEAHVVTEEKVCECEGVSVRVRGSGGGEAQVMTEGGYEQRQ